MCRENPGTGLRAMARLVAEGIPRARSSTDIRHKAASEMLERLCLWWLKSMRPLLRSLTFHAFGLQRLQHIGERFGLTSVAPENAHGCAVAISSACGRGCRWGSWKTCRRRWANLK